MLLPALVTGGIQEQSAFDCRKMLNDYFKNINITSAPPAGKAYYMNMKIRTVMHDSLAYPANESSLKITVAKDLYYYKSEQMDLYKDEKDVFVIVHASGTAVWSSAKDIPEAGNWNSAFLLRDSLIRESQVVECRELDVKHAAGKVRKITIEPPVKRQKQTHIRNMDFYFNSANGSLERSTVYYDRKSSIHHTITTFKEMNLNASAPAAKSVRELVLDRNNKPAGIYKGYKLIDNRKK